PNVLLQLRRMPPHVQAFHAHPAGAVGLFKMPAGWKRCRTIEYTDVVEAEKAALKNVRAVGVLAVHPPGKVQQQLVKDFFQKGAVRDSANAPLDFVNAPRRPRMNRWVDIAKRP